MYEGLNVILSPKCNTMNRLLLVCTVVSMITCSFVAALSFERNEKLALWISTVILIVLFALHIKHVVGGAKHLHTSALINNSTGGKSDDFIYVEGYPFCLEYPEYYDTFEEAKKSNPLSVVWDHTSPTQFFALHSLRSIPTDLPKLDRANADDLGLPPFVHSAIIGLIAGFSGSKRMG